MSSGVDGFEPPPVISESIPVDLSLQNGVATGLFLSPVSCYYQRHWATFGKQAQGMVLPHAIAGGVQP